MSIDTHKKEDVDKILDDIKDCMEDYIAISNRQKAIDMYEPYYPFVSKSRRIKKKLSLLIKALKKIKKQYAPKGANGMFKCYINTLHKCLTNFNNIVEDYTLYTNICARHNITDIKLHNLKEVIDNQFDLYTRTLEPCARRILNNNDFFISHEFFINKTHEFNRGITFKITKVITECVQTKIEEKIIDRISFLNTFPILEKKMHKIRNFFSSTIFIDFAITVINENTFMKWKNIIKPFSIKEISEETLKFICFIKKHDSTKNLSFVLICMQWMGYKLDDYIEKLILYYAEHNKYIKISDYDKLICSAHKKGLSGTQFQFLINWSHFGAINYATCDTQIQYMYSTMYCPYAQWSTQKYILLSIKYKYSISSIVFDLNRFIFNDSCPLTIKWYYITHIINKYCHITYKQFMFLITIEEKYSKIVKYDRRAKFSRKQYALAQIKKATNIIHSQIELYFSE